MNKSRRWTEADLLNPDKAERGPKPRRMQRLEQELQIAIVSLADTLNFPKELYHLHRWLMPPVKVGEFLHHTPNGGGRSKAEGGIFKAMGLRAGYPDQSFDLAMVAPGYASSSNYAQFFPGWRCELKIDDAKLRPNQQIIAERLMRAGYVYTVARSIDEWMDQLADYLAKGTPLYRGVFESTRL